MQQKIIIPLFVTQVLLKGPGGTKAKFTSYGYQQDIYNSTFLSSFPLIYISSIPLPHPFFRFSVRISSRFPKCISLWMWISYPGKYRWPIRRSRTWHTGLTVSSGSKISKFRGKHKEFFFLHRYNCRNTLTNFCVGKFRKIPSTTFKIRYADSLCGSCWSQKNFVPQWFSKTKWSSSIWLQQVVLQYVLIIIPIIYDHFRISFTLVPSKCY